VFLASSGQKIVTCYGPLPNLSFFWAFIKTFFILRSVFSLFWPKYCNLSWSFAKSFFLLGS